MSLLFSSIRMGGLSGKIAFICLLSLLSTSWDGVQAAPFSLEPSLGLSHEYQDNVLFSAGETHQDHITQLTGILAVTQKEQRFKSHVRTRLVQFFYHDMDQLNGEDKAVDIGAEYHWNERTTSRIGFSWARDNLRGTGALETGLALTGDRDNNTLIMGTVHALSELSNVSLTLDMGESDLKNLIQDEDNQRFTAALDYTRSLTGEWSTTQLNTGVNYSRYQSRINSHGSPFAQVYDTHVFQAGAGFTHHFSPLWQIYFQAGFSHTDARRLTSLLQAGQENKDHALGGVFRTGLSYGDMYQQLNLTLSRDIRDDGGTSGAVTRTSGAMGYQYRISAPLSLHLAASVFHNKNKATAATHLDTMTYNFSSSFQYRFSPTLVFSGGYQFSEISYGNKEDERNKNRIFIEINQDFNFDID